MAFGNYSAWQYSRWLWNIARNSRITDPTASEKAAIIVFLKAIWNPVTQTGTREWLQTMYQSKATAADNGDDYECDLDNEPVEVLVEILGAVARDLKKIPITDAEAVLAGTLITATGNRRLGVTPYFGGVGGSIVTVP